MESKRNPVSDQKDDDGVIEPMEKVRSKSFYVCLSVDMIEVDTLL